MKSAQLTCCNPAAFDLLRKQLPHLETTDGLLNGALAISMHQLDRVDVSGIDAKLHAYADTIRSRVKGNQEQALIAHLHEFLFEEEGFAGNVEDYYALGNSYIPTVLQTKRGMPITLSLIYKVVADRLGLQTWGIGLPGHFVLGMQTEWSAMIVDPFDKGRILTLEECHGKLREMFGEDTEWSDDFLEPVSVRHWLARMLQNLIRAFTAQGLYKEVAAILEMEMLLMPDQDHLQRDLGLVLARIGMSKPASVWLDKYLKSNPDDPQREDLEQLRKVLT